MARTQPEARIVAAIIKRLNAMPNTYVRKTHGSRYSSGWPDIVGAIDGVSVALEVKTATGKATEIQLHELRKWWDAGARCGVVRSVDDAVRVALGVLVDPRTMEVER